MPLVCSVNGLVNTSSLSPPLQCELLMLNKAQVEVGSVLFSLFWSVQGSLLSWCYLQLKSTDPGAKELAVDLIEKCKFQDNIHENRCLGFDSACSHFLVFIHWMCIWFSFLDTNQIYLWVVFFFLKYNSVAYLSAQSFLSEYGSMPKFFFLLQAWVIPQPKHCHCNHTALLDDVTLFSSLPSLF